MTERVERLRLASYDAAPSISTERAELLTAFYRENDGRYPVPIMRALSFAYICRHKTIWIGDDELIVGERGPRPKATPTYPELTCHSEEDLLILRTRGKTHYQVTDEAIAVYGKEIIPYWRGRSMRDRAFPNLPSVWHDAYEAGMFTEFMEQRAPGHTSLDDKIYGKGLIEIKEEIDSQIGALDWATDPKASAKHDELEAMKISCDAAIHFAQRHADMADEMALTATPERRAELLTIAEVCRRVPAQAPRNLHEAIQMYWFVHLGTITELNGWDAMNPGRLDQHLFPFYHRDLEAGTLTRETATELIECFWIKFNNHPAPPKVGVTAEESGTYNDFTNINIGGLTPEGADGVNELSHVLLEVIDDIHLLQPGTNIQLSRKNPDNFLRATCKVISKGYGYPAIFNADAVVEELVRMGKDVIDARQGGTSGCVETGCFGKEAYILTGYLNTPKILEIALNNGVDPKTGKQIGLKTGEPRDFETLQEVLDAFRKQLHHFVEIKVRGNAYMEHMYAEYAPAPFLSVFMDDCIAEGRDYNAGGARYNTSYIQCVGIGSITDSLSAMQTHVFNDGAVTMDDLLQALERDYGNDEPLRMRLSNRTPRYGNNEAQADGIMEQVFDALFDEIDGRPNGRGGQYHVDMLPTTCHIYFGSVMGAMPDGRKAGMPLSEGISPVQGADRNGPTAVLQSAARMDHLRTGGTLLNQRLLPDLLKNEAGIDNLVHLIRTYFDHDAHHIQFNVVDTPTLRRAQKNPEENRDLLVRVAGYSDYFCDLGEELQEEIIARTAQQSF